MSENINKYTLAQMGNKEYGTGDIYFTGEYLFPYFFSYTPITSFSSDTVTAFTKGGNGDGMYVFNHCTSLTSIHLGKSVALGAGGYQFANCTSLTSVDMKKQTSTGQYFFSGCTSLQKLALPSLTGQGNGRGFKGCSKLEVLDLGSISRIYTEEMMNCPLLATIIIRRSSVPTLSNVNAFSNTPFASGKAGGTLYVPSALIDSYKTASNWNTIFGYGDGEQNQIKAIEDSYYETHYGDDVLIPSS